MRISARPTRALAHFPKKTLRILLPCKTGSGRSNLLAITSEPASRPQPWRRTKTSASSPTSSRPARTTATSSPRTTSTTSCCAARRKTARRASASGSAYDLPRTHLFAMQTRLCSALCEEGQSSGLLLAWLLAVIAGLGPGIFE